jgi:hypothetical protein
MKMTKKQIVSKINELLADLDACVIQKLEKRHARVIAVLVKFLNMPEFVGQALSWGYTRTMIGSLDSTEEAKSRDKAYDCARGLITTICESLETSAVYTYSECRRKIAKYTGECAGHLFAAKERIGT